MKRLIILMMMTTTANAIEQGDYGYGYWHHGYSSIEQQEEAQHNQYYLQQRMQIRVDEDLDNRLNESQFKVEDTPLLDTQQSE